MSSLDLARFIDHSLLAPDATTGAVDRLCAEALEFGFATVCVRGVHARRCAEALEGSSVGVCAVVDFPLGASATEEKVLEAQRALNEGASEIDMVANLRALVAGDLDEVTADVRAVADVCHASGARLKVILETGLLTDMRKQDGARAAVAGGADFVKTSTGFGPSGANVHDVELLRSAVGDEVGVKAAGGIREAATARALIAAGANRIGCSASVQIVRS